MQNTIMLNNPLGQKTEYKPYYDANLLFPIPRVEGREEQGVEPAICVGYDRWFCYELSWLGPGGKPEVRTMRLVYPSSSRCIVESKSLKLYLGSFIMSRFETEQEITETIKRDLSQILGADWVDVRLFGANQISPFSSIDESTLIDALAVECTSYSPDANLLQIDNAATGAASQDVTLFSHLLKTNCPMTGQPDWATVSVIYRSQKILQPESLVRYLVSYREHGGYHELCCEQIFSDVLSVLKPEKLMVKCHFTRRGGIDITPCRFFGSDPDSEWNTRYSRQ